MQLLYGHDEYIANQVSNVIGIDLTTGPYRAIGVVENDGKMIGGVIYNNFTCGPEGKPISIELSLAMVDKKWCSRNNIRALLAYPFIQLDVKRLQVTCREDDVFLRDLHARFGFTFEGIARDAHPLGGNSAVSSMLKHECKWIENGKILT